MEGAYSNFSCTVVMDEGHQKSKRLSHMAKFKREVIQCAEEKGNCKAAAIFGVDEKNVTAHVRATLPIADEIVSL
jgi:hypothetical protein